MVVLTKRVVRYATGQTQKFAPRQANQTQIEFIGPFAKRRTAEQAAIAARSTPTCLKALVLDAEGLEAAVARGLGHYEADKEARHIIMSPKVDQGNAVESQPERDPSEDSPGLVQ